MIALEVKDGEAEDSDRQQTQSDRAYAQVRNLIVTGKVAPGERLREVALAERLDMSRTPIREALDRLRYEGFAQGEFHPGGRRERTVASPLTQTDADELYQLVGVVEGIAARKVAAYNQSERDVICNQMGAINEELRRIAETENTTADEALRTDGRLHERYFRPVAERRLESTYSVLKAHTRRYTLAYRQLYLKYLENSVRDHERIIKHLRAGEPLMVEQAVRENYMNACERTKSAIKIERPRGTD